MARLALTEVNTVTTPAAFTPDRTSDQNRNMKRTQFQWSRPVGITASSFTLMARLSPDLPWTAVLLPNTTASGLMEVPPYPAFAVALTTLTGSGTFLFDVKYPD